MRTHIGFGPLLREWRLTRHLTQQALAERAEISTRHLSFLETGRSQASREMVLVLGNALDMPLRERNVLLDAAGYAPVYRETSIDAPAMGHVRVALDRLLAQQEPYPALVMDRTWNVLRINDGAARMLTRLCDGAQGDPAVFGNLVHALFHPHGLRRAIVDWPDVAAIIAERLQREAAADRSEGGLRALRDAVMAYPGVPELLHRASLDRPPAVTLNLHLRAPDGAEIQLFTMITSLGTPLDVTAEELRIELMFPVDEASAAWLRGARDNFSGDGKPVAS
jgi:transcriptional regulator with XRE-family HTH domain